MSDLLRAAQIAAVDVSFQAPMSFLHGEALRNWPYRMPNLGNPLWLLALKRGWSLPYGHAAPGAPQRSDDELLKLLKDLTMYMILHTPEQCTSAGCD